MRANYRANPLHGRTSVVLPRILNTYKIFILYITETNPQAGHELKSTITLISSGIRQLHIPLSCIISYKGYRVLVIALLPVNKDTRIKDPSSVDTTKKLLEQAAGIFCLILLLLFASPFSVIVTELNLL